MKNCYEICLNISKNIYNFFIYISFRTLPQLESTENNTTTEFCKNKNNYCKMCDLDDFVIEEN